ncbi:MAG TPA: hypothetical protein VHI71_11290 [Actinomycetota bacterium]|nr:hypothetical protein [Actinomycetota bacterium]
MRRKIQLALVAGALAATAIPAAPARASICVSDPQVICQVYYLAASVICKVTKGQNCMT